MDDLDKSVGEDEEGGDDKRLRDEKLKISLIDRNNYSSSQTRKVENILDNNKPSKKDSKEKAL